MADEVLFEFLHMEIVSYVQRSARKDEKVGAVELLMSALLLYMLYTGLYTACCYFMMHSLCADCSFNYFLPL